MRLSDISYTSGAMLYESHHTHLSEDVFDGYLAEADAIRQKWLQEAGGESLPVPELDEAFERWRWFPLPHEILPELQGKGRCCEGRGHLAPQRT